MILGTALALSSYVGIRYSGILLLNCSIALLISECLVFVDDLRLENTLCDIHGINMFDIRAIQILYF